MILFTSLLAIILPNPIHCLICLILAYLNTSILFITLEVEYLGLVILILYIGAITILFLFVIMMLNLNISLDEKLFTPVIVIVIMLINEIWNNWEWNISIKGEKFNWEVVEGNVLDSLGTVLYEYWNLKLLMVGILLILAIIGAVQLGLVHSKNLHRQDCYIQIVRKSNVTEYSVTR